MSLIVRDLSFTYNPGLPTEAAALKNVSFTAEKGEILSIVGHTGSGKSTLAMHLNGLILPQHGEVTVEGMAIKKKSSDLRKIRQTVGLVFQYPEQQIFAETVMEEISFGPSNWGLSSDVLEARVYATMEMIGLDRSLVSANPFMLSGGEKRRVAIAAVLASDPDYLVLDEPAAGLDFNGLSELVSLLRSMSERGICVIHITHDLELALEISDRILVLSEGALIASGSPSEISEIISNIDVKGLILPDILSLSYELKGKGLTVDITSDPHQLAEDIKAAKIGCR